MKLFEPKDKSTFKYWFAHWCAFQMTALNLGVWKLKYLFHDFEKPWLRLILSYEKVRSFHRRNNRHHLGYKNPLRYDYEAMVIDWECSRFTKKDAPMNARETYEYFITVRYEEDNITKTLLINNIPRILEKFGL